MASVITLAFEHWKAQEAASGKPVLLNEFVFANVPNIDPTKPIDRNEKLPAANQIVHRQAVNKAGLASENAVAYSVTLGAEIGNFDFNWIGLLNKESGTVAMITHAPTQKKLKTQSGQQGNVLTRSFLLEFNGAALETQITTKAETWQIDFTARLTGIDEMQRLISIDLFGEAAFYSDGFEVTRSAEQYTVKKGLAYIGGLRGLLEQNQILNGLRTTKVYADFSYQGNIVSQWRTAIKITAVTTLKNYIDSAGFSHYVFAIAEIDSAGNVKDLRPKGGLSDQNLEALANQIKLDLSKKIDKASITDQLGNDRTKVVSQGLLTEQLGKKQNSGDFATNAALKGGLDKKLDKTGGITTGGITSTSISVNESSSTPKLNIYSARGASTLAFFQYNDGPNWYGKLNIPRVELGKTETLMKVGEFGIGSSGLPQYANMGAAVDYKTGFYGISGTDPRKIPGDGASNIVQVGAGDYFWQIGKTTLNDIVYFRSVKASKLGSWIKIWSESNTTTDRNGHLKALGSAELSDYPPGAPIPWPQATAPAGFLVCNGQSFNKTTYPLLTKAYPSGILPDLRGEFIRGLDAGRNIDENRDVLTAQGDAIREIAGSFAIGGAKSEREAPAVVNGAFTKKTTTGRVNTAASSQNEIIPLIEFSPSNVVPTAPENRPRNIAFLYIVRAA